MSRTRRIAQRVVPAVVSVAALAALMAQVDRHAVVDALSWRVALVLAPALLAYGALTLAIEAWSILRLVSDEAASFGAWTAAKIKCASYLLAIVHYALGVAALTVLLRRRAGLGLAESASIVLLVSSADLLVVLTMGACGAALVETGAPTVRAGILATAGVGFFGGLALLRAPASLGPLEKIRSLAVFEALRSVPLPRLGELLLLRALFSVCFIGVSAAAFESFGLDPPLGTLIVGMMVIAVVAALPIAVAGLGTGQAAFVYVFRDVSDAGTLLALSLVLSAGMIGLRAIMGLVFAREFTREALAETRREEV